MNKKPLHIQIERVIERIIKRSEKSRTAYLAQVQMMEDDSDSDRLSVSCSNMAHVAAAAGQDQDDLLSQSPEHKPNIAILSAYNDMLSAHQPYENYPALLRGAARAAGATAQMAGGVPAMCDGVTQGRPGMELSLFSRDIIALSATIGLSHNVYDGALCLGICDKIVPGLVMGALAFGHLPFIFVPAGPMESGLPNEEKAQIRKAFARGEIGRDALLKAEIGAYHSAGTCTFYGTANSNQMLMEIMGLHLPGAAFVHPHSDLRHALSIKAMHQVIEINRRRPTARPIGRLLDERSFVNAIIGLHATGGSTNHTLHLPAMAAAAGIDVRWEDFADLSEIIPLLTRIYPNGKADVNHFHAAGGMGFVIQTLLDEGLLDGTAATVWGDGLKDYGQAPFLEDNQLVWHAAPEHSADENILRPATNPYAPTGGLKMLSGNMGRAVIKISAVSPERHVISAPAIIFENEADVKRAFNEGRLNQDCIVVVRAQGPRANGMPELHSLTPLLATVQDKGYKIALVTDGRMSGASGSVPAAIHLCPEAIAGGPISQICDGDIITMDATTGRLDCAADLSARTVKTDYDLPARAFGRPITAPLREQAADAEKGGGLYLIDHLMEKES